MAGIGRTPEVSFPKEMSSMSFFLVMLNLMPRSSASIWRHASTDFAARSGVVSALITGKMSPSSVVSMRVVTRRGLPRLKTSIFMSRPSTVSSMERFPCPKTMNPRMADLESMMPFSIRK